LGKNCCLDNINSSLHNQDDQPFQYRDNIYTIFSGGDDCIFVGAWDTIFQWARLVQGKFAEEVVPKTVVYDEKGNQLPITLSGGLIVVEPTYPVIRFADLAEAALGKAKAFKFWEQKENRSEQEATKNRICLFDEVLSWEEFKEANEIAFTLKAMLTPEGNNQKGAPRSILEQIRSTAADFKILQNEALAGQIAGPSVAKLFYYIRHAKNKEKLAKKIIEPYADDLIDAFTLHHKKNPMKYPVAARWAELLTRSKA